MNVGFVGVTNRLRSRLRGEKWADVRTGTGTGAFDQDPNSLLNLISSERRNCQKKLQLICLFRFGLFNVLMPISGGEHPLL